MITKETLYYTYLDECKKNFLTDIIKKNGQNNFNEYSITSITFEQEYYKNKFEPLWVEFREKYNIDGSYAMHFVEYKKLIDPCMQNDDNCCYKIFLSEGKFSITLLKDFFKELKKLLEDAEFFVVHNDFYWESKQYLNNRKKMENVDMVKASRNIAPSILNNVPYIAMKNHLDLLMQFLLKQEIESSNQSEKSFYFDPELPKKINTKLRFDADGKQFDARDDLKKAYNHTISIGSDTVNANTSTQILDEIRFIRKDEVGHKYVPNHCGLEVVDFLCSMISGETRLKEYMEKSYIKNSPDLTEGNFINLHFPDGEIIKFDFILKNKLKQHNSRFLNFG